MHRIGVGFLIDSSRASLAAKTQEKYAAKK
jgi:hypothetical protein